MKVIIAGAGEVGFHIARHLALENKDVIVIDKDHEALIRVSENIDAQVIEGSVTNPAVLEEAGIKDAEIVLAVTNSDEYNLIACLISDIISPTTKKLARIRGEVFDKYLENFKRQAPNIDTIINPDVEVVKTIERFMNVSGAVDVGELAGGLVKFAGVYLGQSTQLAGVKLYDLPNIVKEEIPLIAAIIRGDKLIIPRGDDKLMQGDTVYFISDDDKISKALSIFEKTHKHVHNALIIGGGRIGLRLALLLEKKSIHTKIIERNSKRCRQLAELLDKSVVLHGDGSDQSLLIEENIEEMDAVITLTGDEETNILTSLLAKQMGVKKTITKISKFGYFPLMNSIGLEQVVSPRLSAINTILHQIRRGRVLSAISLKGERAEVIEAVAMETSEIVDKPIKDISIPKRVLITSIIHDKKVYIPSGNSIIRPGDTVIIFAEKEAIPALEKIMAVKLEYF